MAVEVSLRVVAKMSFMLPHLHSGWAVDQAILSCLASGRLAESVQLRSSQCLQDDMTVHDSSASPYEAMKQRYDWKSGDEALATGVAMFGVSLRMVMAWP